MGEQFCISCSKSLNENNGQLIQGTLFEILQVLFDNSNLEFGIGSKICENCEEKVIVAFRFKELCIYTDDRLQPYISRVENAEKVDLKMVYAKEWQCEKPNDGYICRLCLKLVEKRDKNLLIDSLRKENLEDTFNIYLPEVNLEIIKDPIICRRCLQSLGEFKLFRSFIDNIPNFVSNKQLKDNEQGIEIKYESVEVVTANEGEYSDDPVNSNVSNTEDILERFEFISNPGIYRCMLCSREYNTIQPIAKHMRSHIEIIRFKCKVCPYTTILKRALEIHEKNHEKGGYDLKIYQCSKCEYRARMKCQIQYHQRVHDDNCDVFKCSLCSFQTKYKYSIKKHMKCLHSNRKKYKCDMCPAETTHLKKHMKRKHPDPSTIMLTCSKCTYKTIVTNDLTKHMRIHKAESDVELYKCYNCGFVTRYKSYLARHMQLSHMNIPDKHKCEYCDFTTKYKTNLNEHVVAKHRNESEVTMFKCPKCPYKSKINRRLKEHVKMIHNKKAAVYSCRQCDFETKWLKYLMKHKQNKHMKLPTNIPKVGKYQCDVCSYKAKDKGTLKRHMIVHKRGSSRVKMYKCPDCSHQAKFKDKLLQHVLIHSDVEMLECGQCNFKTKYQFSLKFHRWRLHRGTRAKL